MIFHRRLPIRLQLAGLGYSDNDYPGADDPSMLPVFVDIHGNRVDAPVVVDPLTGDTSLDPGVLILQNNATKSREYQFDDPYQPESGYWQSIPGVQSGAIASNSNVSVVVTPRDLQTTGILSLVSATPAPPGSAGYVGPARPASLPMPANTPTQTFTPAPTQASAPAPHPSNAPAPIPVYGGAAVLPSWAPVTSTVTTASGGGGVDAGEPAQGGAAPATGGAGLAALAALAFLFAN